MQDLLTTLNKLKRPRLLINAARIGMTEYRRESHLQRHLGGETLPQSSEALARLLELEVDMNTKRRESAAGYSVSRHVDILIAMMNEARLLRTQGQTD
ncbi:MAG: DUF6477 family protein [Pseudomonadota bacterium]